MNCPKCTNTELRQEVAGEISIDRCPSCHGIWLDALELERLLASNPKELLEDDRHFEAAAHVPGPRLNCPRCKGTYLIKLNSLAHRGTILDSCTVCYGLWLDAGELARLAQPDLMTRLRTILGTR